MNLWENIIIHNSASLFGCAAEIRKWHMVDNGWSDGGYNYVINTGFVKGGKSALYIPVMDGSIEIGRVIDGDPYAEIGEIGAHALGYNSNSIGICLIGRNQDDYTSKQIQSLVYLLHFLCNKYNIPITNIWGHNETKSGKAQGKTCPELDIPSLRNILTEVFLKIDQEGYYGFSK